MATFAFEAGKTAAIFALATNRIEANPFNKDLGIEYHNEWQRGYDGQIQLYQIANGSAIIDDPVANAMEAAHVAALEEDPMQTWAAAMRADDKRIERALSQLG